MAAEEAVNKMDDIAKAAVEGRIESIDALELEEWFDSLEDVLHRYGPEKTRQLLVHLRERAYRRGVMMPFSATTPYLNTTPSIRTPG